MTREPERRFCEECQGPLGESYFDFYEEGHGDICSDCVNSWIDSAPAPGWFLVIMHDIVEGKFRRTAPDPERWKE